MAQQADGVVVWEWLSDHGRWKPYKPSIIRAIEANSSSTTQLGLGKIEPSMSAYAIDLSTCKQIRLNTGLFIFLICLFVFINIFIISQA